MRACLPPMILAALLWVASGPVKAEDFLLPVEKRDSVVGEIRHTLVRPGETLLDIARDTDLGYEQIIAANPGMNRWLPPERAEVLLSSLYVLPRAPREGIVINLAEYRLYYFPPRSRTVMTFPISIGRMDWKTPLGRTKVTQKERNPAWNPPKSIMNEALEEDEEIPAATPGGAPDNPLGKFALKLGRPGYLIHGVDDRKAFGIGMEVTHGCIRLYPEDIEKLFSAVAAGTPVNIVDQPVKVGWLEDELLLEIHRPVDEDARDPMESVTLSEVLDLLREQDRELDVDMDAVRRIFEDGDGVPHRVPRRPREVAPFSPFEER